jgi:hypothetical protein
MPNPPTAITSPILSGSPTRLNSTVAESTSYNSPTYSTHSMVYESSDPTSYSESGLSDFYSTCDPSSSTVSIIRYPSSSTDSTIRDLLQYETYV